MLPLHLGVCISPKKTEVRPASKTRIVLERVGRGKYASASLQSHPGHTHKPLGIEQSRQIPLTEESQRVASPARRTGSGRGPGPANPTKRDHLGPGPSVRQLLTWDIKMKKCLCLKSS